MSTSSQLPLEFDHRASMSGEDFLVAPCNQEAVAWLDHWPDWGAPFVVIYGETGCGKTHLIEVFRQATGALALKLENGLDPYEFMGEAKTAVLDDVESMIGTASGEQALFHLYNFAKENQLSILMTSRTAPAQWNIALPDLKSRMGAVPVVEISSPDDTLMEAVLVKLFADRQLQVERGLIAYMLPRMERSFSAAQSLVDDIDREALAQKRRITVPLVKELLQD